MNRDKLLEKSPFQADGGERVGRHPAEVPSDFLSLCYREKNPVKAIRAKCLDCCCVNAAEVRKCIAVDCPLWPFRTSLNPFRRRRALSSEQRRETTQRLTRARTP
jgi:hypothetical protein